MSDKERERTAPNSTIFAGKITRMVLTILRVPCLWLRIRVVEANWPAADTALVITQCYAHAVST